VRRTTRWRSNAPARAPRRGIAFCETAEAAAKDADAVILVTEWPTIATSTGSSYGLTCALRSSSTAATFSTSAPRKVGLPLPRDLTPRQRQPPGRNRPTLQREVHQGVQHHEQHAHSPTRPTRRARAPRRQPHEQRERGRPASAVHSSQSLCAKFTQKRCRTPRAPCTRRQTCRSRCRERARRDHRERAW